MALETCIPKRAEKFLGNIPSIKELLALHEHNPSLLIMRIDDLHAAHLKMDDLMSKNDPENYPQVLLLKQFLVQKDANLTYRSPKNISAHSKEASQTFKYIAIHTEDEWSFVTTTPDANQLMSRMLLKGYARFLQILDTRLTELPGLYESAIIEVLQKDFPDSELAKDLLPPPACN